MRTTIEISEALFRRAKRRAAEEGTTLREIVESALVRHLSGDFRPTRYRLGWQTETGRILPGVKLDSREALFELMERRA
jgi:hypothetical protein